MLDQVVKEFWKWFGLREMEFRLEKEIALIVVIWLSGLIGDFRN